LIPSYHSGTAHDTKTVGDIIEILKSVRWKREF